MQTPSSNSNSVYYKTKICPFFLRNACMKASSCSYAHSLEELRKPPDFQKTKICPLFMHGSCPFGRDCQFAHGYAELQANQKQFKTTLCYYTKNGKKCPIGDMCKYAHSLDELKQVGQAKSENRNTVQEVKFQASTGNLKDVCQNTGLMNVKVNQNVYKIHQGQCVHDGGKLSFN